MQACGWRLIPKFEDMEDNWTNNHPLHQYEGQYFVDNADGVIKMYVASLYWSIMTITTIGARFPLNRCRTIPSRLARSSADPLS